MPSISKTIGTVMIVFAALTALVTAQIRYLPDATGRWKPWRFVAYEDDRRRFAATPAETRALEAQLVALAGILKQSPGLGAPVGFSVETVQPEAPREHRSARTAYVAAVRQRAHQTSTRRRRPQPSPG